MPEYNVGANEILKLSCSPLEARKIIELNLVDLGYTIVWKDDLNSVLKKGMGRTSVEITSVQGSPEKSVMFVEFKLSTFSNIFWRYVIGGLLGALVASRIANAGKKAMDDVVGVFEDKGVVLDHRSGSEGEY